MKKKRKAKNSNNTEEGTRKKLSAYKDDYHQYLVDNRLNLDDKGVRPKNIDEILERLAQPRRSLSPSKFTDHYFEKIRRLNDTAIGESKVMSTVVRMMLGENDIPSEENILFNNLEPMTDGSLADAKPDLYDGATPIELDPEIRKKLNPYIVPSKHSHAPILPNFSMEVKGSDGSPAVARRQAAMNAHLGTRSMKALRDYGTGSETNDGNARSYVATQVDGHMRLYASHIPEGTTETEHPDYRLTQLRAFAFTDSAERCRECAAALRNTRDLAHEEREEAIKLANERIARERGQATVPDLTQALEESNVLVAADFPAAPKRQQFRTNTKQRHKQLEQEPQLRRSTRRLNTTPDAGVSF
jgi:hypothetical protein